MVCLFWAVTQAWGGDRRAVGSVVLANLATLNAAIATEAATQGADVADNHAVFFDHGMNETGRPSRDPRRGVGGSDRRLTRKPVDVTITFTTN